MNFFKIFIIITKSYTILFVFKIKYRSQQKFEAIRINRKFINDLLQLKN